MTLKLSAIIEQEINREKDVILKIIFLNTWNGETREQICEFIRQHAKDTDIFCFQEAYDDYMRPRCRELLPEFLEVTHDKVTEHNDYAQAMYIKNTIPVLSADALLEDFADCGSALWAKIRMGGRHMYVCNVHGISRPGDKLDTPGRLRQSREMLKFFADKDASVIFGGDFNLLPETESVKMFTDHRYTNLIDRYHIATTRNRHAWEQHPDNKQYYADYVFSSPELAIQQFHVPQNEISDHLPLIVEVETTHSAPGRIIAKPSFSAQ